MSDLLANLALGFGVAFCVGVFVAVLGLPLNLWPDL